MILFYFPCFKGHTSTCKPVEAQSASIKFPVKLLMSDGKFNGSSFMLSAGRARWSGFDATREFPLKALTQKGQVVRARALNTNKLLSVWFLTRRVACLLPPSKRIHVFLPGIQLSVMYYRWNSEFLHYSAIIRLTGRGRRYDRLQRKEKGGGWGWGWGLIFERH